MPKKTIICPISGIEMKITDCSSCKEHCNKIMLAILDDCKNLNDIISLNKKVNNALNGNDAIIVSNSITGGAEAIASINNFEFVYSWSKDKEFESIPEMVSRHQKSAVICTSKKTCDSFINELKKINVNRGIPIRLWTL